MRSLKSTSKFYNLSKLPKGSPTQSKNKEIKMAEIVMTFARLSAESTVPVELLVDNIDLVRLVRDGANFETLLEFVNENW